MYGGAKNRGSKPHRFKKGSGSITRKGVQQLETLNIVGRSDRGRIITAEGRSLMDNLAFDIIKELEKMKLVARLHTLRLFLLFKNAIMFKK